MLPSNNNNNNNDHHIDHNNNDHHIDHNNNDHIDHNNNDHIDNNNNNNNGSTTTTTTTTTSPQLGASRSWHIFSELSWWMWRCKAETSDLGVVEVEASIPKTMKNKDFGHLKTQVIYIPWKTFKNLGLGGHMVFHWWNNCCPPGNPAAIQKETSLPIINFQRLC